MKFLLILFLLCTSQVWAAGEPACAKVATVLHKSPSDRAPVSWRVARYMPFLKMEIKGTWVRVQDLDGENHWIPAKELTSSISCVVVRSTSAPLRVEPASEGQLAELKTLDRYTPLKKLEVSGEWVKVETEAGHKAWIHESNVWKPSKIQSVKF